MGGWVYLVLLRVVSDGFQVTHQELEGLVVVAWQVTDLWGGIGSLSPSGGSPGRCPQPCPMSHVPTSFLSVLILSLASSIRLASMKSLYLSESGTRGCHSRVQGTGHPLPESGTPG